MERARKKWKQRAALILALFVFLANCVTGSMPVMAAAKAPTKITLNCKSKTIAVGGSVTLKVKSVTPEKASKDVTWKTSNKKIATVTQKGVVKGKKAGEVTITAQSKANKKIKATCKITVSKIEKITLNYSSTSMSVGDKLTLKVKSVSPKGASKSVTWKTSNKKIATVTEKGVVKAKKNGTVTITAQSKENAKVKATCKIKVYKATKTIKLSSKKSYTLDEGKTLTLKAKVTSPKSGAAPITWSSQNKKIAKVTSAGKVTAVKEGTTKIIGQSGTKKVSVKITVQKPETEEEKETESTEKPETEDDKNSESTEKPDTEGEKDTESTEKPDTETEKDEESTQDNTTVREETLQNGYGTIIKEYNAAGQLIQETVRTGGKTDNYEDYHYIEYIYEYDESGRVKKVKTVKSFFLGAPTSAVYNTIVPDEYDNKGRMIRSTTYRDSDGVNIYSSEYEYYENGQVKKEITNTLIISTTNYVSQRIREYYEGGQAKKITISYSDGDTYVYEFVENGTTYKRTMYKDGSWTSIEHEYYENGFEKKKTYTYSDGSWKVYEYYKDGTNKKITTTYPDGRVEAKEYDEDREIIKHTVTYPDGTVKEYDEDGNEIS